MVYYSTAAEIHSAFAHMVGAYDYASHIHHPDSAAALTLAGLQPGESVLDVGAGGGRFIAEAKQRVGNGYCVAVDAVQGFLSTDIPWMLQQRGLAVSPNGAPAAQVYCMRANISDSNLAAKVRALPGVPQTFDCIVALHLFTTVPPHQRRQALVTLRQLLSPSGRLILNMSARFTTMLPSAADAARPVQFRTAEHTEAPGASILTEFRANGPRVQIPRGGLGQPRKVVALTIQIAPDQLWTVAATQAREAAVDAGFHVNAVRNIGKGDDFGLPAGQRSPAQAALNAMTLQQLVQTAQTRPTPNAYNCIGRTGDTFVRRTEPAWAQSGPHARDCILVQSHQSFVVKDKERVAKDSAGLPAGGAVVAKTLEWTQIGVLLSLSKV